MLEIIALRLPVSVMVQSPDLVVDAAPRDVFQLDMPWVHLIANAVRSHHRRFVTVLSRTVIHGEGAPRAHAVAAENDILCVHRAVDQVLHAHVSKWFHDGSKQIRDLRFLV